MLFPSLRHVALRLLPLLLVLVLCWVLLLLSLRTPPLWSLDVGAADNGHDTRFISNFSVPESSGEQTFRWSTPSSRLLLHGAGTAPTTLDLLLYGDERSSSGAEWQLQIASDYAPDTPLATFAMAPHWRTYRILLPPQKLSAGTRATPLNLTSSSYQSTPQDHRELGVPLASIQLTPLESDAGGWSQHLLWRTLWLTALLALLALVGWRADSFLLRRYPELRPWRVSGLVLVLAMVLLLWAERNSYTLAWALPAAPWMLGLSTLLATQWRMENGEWTMPDNAPRWLISAFHSPFPALSLLVVAQILFHMRWMVGLGIVAAILGIVLLANGKRISGQELFSGQEPFSILHSPFAIFFVFLLALGMRFYQLGELPYGLWRDEANHGLIALHILEDPGYRPIYAITTGVNMPALGLYPFVLAHKLWGIHIWTMRPITALAGALTVLPLYGLVAQLTRRRDRALLAATLLAVSSWHLTISRFSFPTVFDPLLALTGLWLMVRAWNDQPSSSLRRFALLLLAGICLGLAMQTYHTGRVVPVVAGMLAVLLFRPVAWRQWLVGVVVLGLGFLLAVGPLLVYALGHMEAFNDRLSGVFLLSQEALQGRAPLAVLDDSLGRHALMFNVQGDSNGRHHAPDKPMLDFVTGLGFLAGTGWLLRQSYDWRSRFLAIALMIGLLPSLLAVEGPHAMRSIGAAAFACIIAALGWAEIVGWAVDGGRRTEGGGGPLPPARYSPFCILHSAFSPLRPLTPHLWSMLAIMLCALLLNARTYFVQMPSNPAVWQSSYPVHTQVGAYIRQLAQTDGEEALQTVYVQSLLADNQVFAYLTHDLPVQTFDGRDFSRPVAVGTRFVFSGYASQQEVAEKIGTYVGTSPTPVLSGPALPNGEASFRVYAAK